MGKRFKTISGTLGVLLLVGAAGAGVFWHLFLPGLLREAVQSELAALGAPAPTVGLPPAVAWGRVRFEQIRLDTDATATADAVEAHFTLASLLDGRVTSVVVEQPSLRIRVGPSGIDLGALGNLQPAGAPGDFPFSTVKWREGSLTVEGLARPVKVSLHGDIVEQADGTATLNASVHLPDRAAPIVINGTLQPAAGTYKAKTTIEGIDLASLQALLPPPWHPNLAVQGSVNADLDATYADGKLDLAMDSTAKTVDITRGKEGSQALRLEGLKTKATVTVVSDSSLTVSADGDFDRATLRNAEINLQLDAGAWSAAWDGATLSSQMAGDLWGEDRIDLQADLAVPGTPVRAAMVRVAGLPLSALERIAPAWEKRLPVRLHGIIDGSVTRQPTPDAPGSLILFVLQGSDLTFAGKEEPVTGSAKRVHLQGVIQGTEPESARMSASLRMEAGTCTYGDDLVALKDVTATVPLVWNGKKPNGGRLRAETVTVKGVALQPLTGTLALHNKRADLALDWEALPGARIDASGWVEAKDTGVEGEVDLSLPTFKLDKANTFRQFFAWAKDIAVRGTFAARGRLHLKNGTLTPDLHVTAKPAQVRWSKKNLSISEITGRIGVRGFIPFQTGARQRLQAKHIALGDMVLTDGACTYTVEGPDRIALHAAQANWAGGTVSLEPMMLNPADEAISLVLVLEHVDLSQLLAFLPFDKIRGTAQMSGRLPLTWRKGRLVPGEGKLTAQQGTGRLRITDAEWLGQTLAAQNSRFETDARLKRVKEGIIETMRNMACDELWLEVVDDGLGGAALQLHAAGESDEATPTVPIILDLNLADFDKLLNVAIMGKEWWERMSKKVGSIFD